MHVQAGERRPAAVAAVECASCAGPAVDSHMSASEKSDSVDIPDRPPWAIEAEQLRLSTRSMPAVIGGGVFAVLVLAFALRDQLPPAVLLAWVLASLAAYAVNSLVHFRFARVAADDRKVVAMGPALAATSLLTAACWVAFMLLVLPAPPHFETLIGLAVCLIAVGAVTNYGWHRRGLLVFVMPCLGTLAFSFLRQRDEMHVVLGAGVLVLAMVILFYANRQHFAVRRWIAQKFEMEALARKLERQYAIAEAARVDADRANAAKTRFLASASHDLRQPMHALGLLVGALQLRVEDPAQREIVERMDASVAAMDGLFGALLDLSKLDAGAVVAELREFPLDELFGHLEMQYGPQADEAGIRLRVVPTRALVRSDPVLLDRVLRNLLANAIRYTSAGGVLLGCRRAGERLRIEVWDTGAGIPAERIPEIFQEYVQLANPTRDRSKGIGLGLSIVQRLGRLLDMPVAVRSVVGRGSVFGVSVPLAGWATPAQARSGQEAALRFAGVTVLVVDDEQDILEGMRTLLTGMGCEVRLARSADEALRLAGEGAAPQMLISDYRIADDHTGEDVVHRVRALLGACVPALLISGDTLALESGAAEATGIPVLHKPVSAARLSALMHAMLPGRAVATRPS